MRSIFRYFLGLLSLWWILRNIRPLWLLLSGNESFLWVSCIAHVALLALSVGWLYYVWIKPENWPSSIFKRMAMWGIQALAHGLATYFIFKNQIHITELIVQIGIFQMPFLLSAVTCSYWIPSTAVKETLSVKQTLKS